MSTESHPEVVLRSLFDAAGEETNLDRVTIRGKDPAFPTPLLTGDAAAAVIAAGAAQAAEIWRMRSGEDQDVTVDVDAAGANMRSRRYLSLENPPPRPQGELRQTGRYRTKDDRFYLFQRTFAHHIAAQISVLGCEPTEEGYTEATAKWNALELEDAVEAAGATPGFVRTHEEWDALEHARVLARLPLFDITKIGESDPEPFGLGDRPLSGIRVLDLTRVLAGPTCGRTLAEHGAEVLRIGTDAFPDDRTMMMDTGHGKRSSELDLKSAEGHAALDRLVPGADVFSQGYRPGAIAGLGYSPEALAEARPGIVCVSLSAFGHEGPWSGRRGFDSVFQAVSGINDELSKWTGLGQAGNPLDYITGYLGAFGALVALTRRANEGGSYHIRVSLGQTGTWLNTMGRASAEDVAKMPENLSDERNAEITTTEDTPFGRLTHLLPAAEMSKTPTRWDRPTGPLDQNPPEWL